MVDRPIIFSAPMIRALIDGRKTQTRRVIVPPAPFDIGDDITVQLATGEIRPRWAAGDRLWVKESWRTSVGIDRVRPSKMEIPGGGYGWPLWYEADDGAVTWRGSTEGGPGFVTPGKLRPSIFLPRWGSRLTLTITDVRTERLHDISEEDARAEGAKLHVPCKSSVAGTTIASDSWHFDHDLNGRLYEGRTARDAFEVLWGKINGWKSWDANPFVAAITFEVARSNIHATTHPEPSR